MALQDVREKADTTYYNYTPLDEPKDNVKTLKKDQFVEGFYYDSYQRDGSFGKQWNHVLISEDNKHHVIPNAKDVDEMFLEEAKKGMFTRYTYLGKKSFEYENKDPKTGEVKKGKAKAIQGLIQQDPEKTCSFEGSKYAARVVLGNTTPTNTTKDGEVSVTNQDVPF